jgi:hypothetical protein
MMLAPFAGGADLAVIETASPANAITSREGSASIRGDGAGTP